VTQAQRTLVASGIVVIVGLLCVDIAWRSVWLDAAVSLAAIAWFIALGVRLGVRGSPVGTHRLGAVLARVVARGIDGLILILALFYPTTVMAWDSRVSFVSFALFWFLCYPPCEYFWGGTPGKLLLGLRVADDQGGPPSWRAVALRSALSIATFVGLWPIELVVMHVSRRKKRLGDMVAHTVVERR
jgi:uncharacterized RDD family membrane protein YckC